MANYNFVITGPWCSMLNQSNTTKFDRRVIIKYGSSFSYTLAAEISDNKKYERSIKNAPQQAISKLFNM
jgi:hypothetical protein